MSAREETFGRRLLRNAAQFTAGQGISTLASIARIALSARYLSKEANGLWVGLQLVLSYGSLIPIGSILGAFRSIPLLRGKGDDEGAAKEEQTCFTFTLAVTLLGAPLVYAVAALAYPTATTRQVLGTAVLVVLTIGRGYTNSIYKAKTRFKELSAGLILGAVAAFLALPLIVVWGLDGLIAVSALQTVVEVGYLTVRAWPLPRLGLSLAVLWDQLKVGIMMLLSSLATLLLTTIDRTVMIERLGTDATGAYYIGANIMVLMPALASMPAAVLTPHFFARVGRGESVRSLVERPVQLASLGFAALVALGAVATPAIVTVLWPKQVEGIASAQAALFATYALVVGGLVGNVYYAHSRQGLQLAALLFASGAAFGLAHLGTSATGTITGAAAGAAAGQYVYLAAAILGAFVVLGDVRAGLRTLASALWPIAYAGAAAALTQAALDRYGPRSIVLRGALGLVVVLVLVAPLLARVRRLVRAGLAGGPPQNPAPKLT